MKIATALKQFVLRRLAIRGNVRIGENFHVGPGSVLWAPSRLVVEDDVYVGRNVTIQVDGRIGAGTMIANNVGLVGRRDHDSKQVGSSIRDSRWVGDHPQEMSDPTYIEGDVWIGFGAIILSGVRVGRSAIVAAGSVVTSDVAPGAIVAGVPARVVGSRFASPELLAKHWDVLGGC